MIGLEHLYDTRDHLCGTWGWWPPLLLRSSSPQDIGTWRPLLGWKRYFVSLLFFLHYVISPALSSSGLEDFFVFLLTFLCTPTLWYHLHCGGVRFLHWWCWLLVVAGWGWELSLKGGVRKYVKILTRTYLLSKLSHLKWRSCLAFTYYSSWNVTCFACDTQSKVEVERRICVNFDRKMLVVVMQLFPQIVLLQDLIW